MPVGNVLDQPLESLWKHSPLLREIRDVRRKDRTGCHGCSFEHQCSYCPGKAYVENRGDWLAPSALQCHDTTGKVHGILQYNAERVHPHTGVRFPIETPEAEAPQAPLLSPAIVQSVSRDQRGAPRRKAFRILSEADLQAARAEAAAPQRATRGGA
jgi:hypothetical protein